MLLGRSPGPVPMVRQTPWAKRARPPVRVPTHTAVPPPGSVVAARHCTMSFGSAPVA